MFNDVPDRGLVVLLGGPASGKSAFARLAFDRTAIVSSDDVRALAGADPWDRVASDRAFSLLTSVVDVRLGAGGFTVVDSTGARWDVLSALRELARRHDVPVTFIEVTATLDECLQRNGARVEGRVPEEDVADLVDRVQASLTRLTEEGLVVRQAQSLLRRWGSGKRIFLAMPVTENIGAAGFRADKRRFYDRIHAAVQFGGFAISSAAISENYGERTLPPSAFTAYDIDEIAAADCVIAATPTALSSDIYLEIGLALGAGKPVGLLLPTRGRTTAMMRGLAKLGVVKRVHFECDEDLPRDVLRMALSLIGSRR